MERPLRVHCINLDRSRDRLAEFTAANSHLTEVERFPAVDGYRLDVPALAQEGLVTPDILSSFSPGAVGVALSHKSLWQAAIDGNRMLTISEDDVIFHSQFEGQAPEVLKTLPPDWDIIFWGWNFDVMMIFDMLPGISPCVAQFNQAKMQSNTRAFQQLPISPRAYKLIWSFGMTCYSISPKGAANLKSKCFPLRPTVIPWPEGVPKPAQSIGFRNIGIDATLNSLYRDLNAYVCFPPLVISPNERAKSTIQPGGKGAVPAAVPEAPAPTEDIAAVIRRGIDLHRAGRAEEALAQLDKALGLKPDETQALTCRGNVLIDLGRFEHALANYDRLLALRPDDVSALNLRGLALESLNRPAEALASYDRAINVAPASLEAHYNRGNILADLGRHDEALASYDRALAIKPDVAPILNNRGLVLEQMQRVDEAIASYEQALKVKPDYAAPADNRKLLLEQISQAAARNN